MKEEFEELFYKVEKGSVSEKKNIRERMKNVDEYISIADPETQKYWRGQGIKKAYPQAFDEIEWILKNARYEARGNYGDFGMLDKMRKVLEPIENPKIKEDRQTKYRAACRKFIYEKTSHEAIAIKNALEEKKERLKKDGKFDESMVDADFQFKLAFEEFFEPVLKHKEIKQKFEELSSRKKELVRRYQSIAQNSYLIKSEKKQRWAEIQEELGKIKLELKSLENAFKAREILINNFIPDYQKEEEPKLALEQMYDKFSKKFKKKQKEK